MRFRNELRQLIGLDDSTKTFEDMGQQHHIPRKKYYFCSYVSRSSSPGTMRLKGWGLRIPQCIRAAVAQGTSGRRAGTAKRGRTGWDSPRTHSHLCKAAALRRVRCLLALQAAGSHARPLPPDPSSGGNCGGDMSGEGIGAQAVLAG